MKQWIWHGLHYDSRRSRWRWWNRNDKETNQHWLFFIQMALTTTSPMLQSSHGGLWLTRIMQVTNQPRILQRVPRRTKFQYWELKENISSPNYLQSFINHQSSIWGEICMYRFNGMPLHCVPFSSMIVVTVLRKSKVEPWPARCFTLAVGLEQHNEQRSNRCFEFIGWTVWRTS